MSNSGSLSTSDEALIAALAIWAGAEEPAFLLRLGHQRARALAEAKRELLPYDPLVWLKNAHRAQMVPDPSRVHDSWYVRALHDESPAVQLIVLESIGEPLRSTLIRELAINPNSVKPVRPANPEVRQIALSLWTERLLGDLPLRSENSAAIAVFVGSHPVGLYRLCRIIGLAKLSSLSNFDSDHFRKKQRDRLQLLQTSINVPSTSRLEVLARNDWVSVQGMGRHALASLGLITLGRMIGKAEAYRLRWALQQIPYSIAKRLRSTAKQPPATVKTVVEWEAGFLSAARQLLLDEEQKSERSLLT